MKDRFAAPPPGGWETLSTRTVLQDQWLHVAAERVRTPAGTVLDPFWVLLQPDWVTVIALTNDQRIVMIREWRQAVRQFVLMVPGGIIEGDDPVATGAKELAEETGYRAARLRHAGSMFPDPARNANRCHVILAEGCELAGAQQLEAGETIEPVLLPIAEVRAMLLRGEIESGLHAASLLRGLSAAGLMEKP